MYQQTTIVGNVGRDPDLRYTQAGDAVCSFSVAVNKTWNDKASGEKRQQTTWFKVTAWRQLAETCNQYVKKGMLVMVTGEVKVSAYTNQSNEPAASLELTADNVRFLTRADEGSGDSDSGSGTSGSDASGRQQFPDEDIPF